VTLFDWPWAVPNRPGVSEIGPIALRVAGDAVLDYWEARPFLEPARERIEAGLVPLPP
jgi:hypothetical protein